MRFAAGGFGTVLGLAMLKLGNPVILDSYVARPQGFLEWLLGAWPVAWGYALLAVAVIPSLILHFRRDRQTPGWLLALPLAWLAWQFVASLDTVDGTLTRATLPHFVACLICFFGGYGVLARCRESAWFWIPVIAVFGLVLFSAFGQHYGGLEQTRAMIRQQPGWDQMPAEFLRRIESDRVFGTVFYANTLASLVLLALPAALVQTWQMLATAPRTAKAVTVGLLAYAGMACLYWSGSKGGWLVAASVMAVMAWQGTPNRRVRFIVAGLILALGVAGLGLRFAGYFQRGATSAVARLDCWKAVLHVVHEHPITGSGPGTFGTMYKRLKRPESEMARLTHNDYLQQASDSGMPGFVAYLAWIAAGLHILQSRRRESALNGALWLGFLAWTLHSVLEFGLYIPAMAWTAFALLGMGLGVTGSSKVSVGQQERPQVVSAPAQ
jgi:O-antigen ligase